MALSRRTFLQVAGTGAAAGALAACAPRAPDTPRPSTSPPAAATPPGPAPSVRPDPVAPDWARLRERLAGRLFRPGDPGYTAAKQSYNPVFDQRNVAAVARVANPADVQACLELASASRIPIAARSGGHSYPGYSTPNKGLIVDLGSLHGVQVGPDGTATIGAGTRLMEIYTALARAGRCLPGGSCPTVGIAGLTLGGGVGVLTTKLGLTCDALRSAQVVTPDGTLRTASASAEPDLFWGLRGGGGGNFGIVTSFAFATSPAPSLTVCRLRFPAGSLTDVLAGWQRFLPSAPDELWTTLGISGGAPPTCRITGCFVGNPAGANGLLDRLIAETGVTPTQRSATAKSYLDAMRFFGGCSTLSAAQCQPSWNGDGGVLQREAFTASSRVLVAPTPEPGRIAELMTGRGGMDLLLDSIGGAAARVGPADTAFPYRGALATVQIYQGATTAAARTAVAQVRTGLGELLGSTGYVNYLDPDMPDWADAYYGANAGRLRQVARRYDPDKVLAFPQSL